MRKIIKTQDHSTETEENNTENLQDNIEVKFNELNDKYLRLLAENQNLRKNHEQEKEDILKYGSFSFAQQILSLTDNLDRAFQIFKNDEKFKTDEFKNILNGIEMIEKELQSTLEKIQLNILIVWISLSTQTYTNLLVKKIAINRQEL